MIQSVLSLSLKDLCNKLRMREISCEELCRFYLARIEKYGMDNALNCVRAVNPDAINEARKLDSRGPEGLPLFGLCVLLKDNIDVKGMATTAGSVALKDNIVNTDAPFVQSLRMKGAVILGKTNMTEFANFLTSGMPAGFSSLGGQVKNAYDKTYTPSGSSSGSAVAMSAGLCSFSVGTDTSFSVVGCATDNGVVGYKPSIGTISTKGVVPITSLLDEIGFFTRDISDMKFITESLIKTDEPKNAVLRRNLALWTFNSELVSKEQMGRYEMLFERMKADGWSFTEQTGRNTYKLQEVGLRRLSMEIREYLETHKGNGLKKLTPEDILEVYRENPGKLAPYGTEFLEKSLAYESEPDNVQKICKIREEMVKEHDLLMEELGEFDACVMTGPTCIMHFAGLPSLSVPFTVASENAIPRSVILFGTNMRSLLDVGEEVYRHGDAIPMPDLENVFKE